MNSRHQKKLNRVWRRRQCEACNTVFTTEEAVDLTGSVVVRTPKAVRPFQRDKLFLSIFDSLKHRKTALADATALTDTVLSQLALHMQAAALDKVVVADVTLKVLNRFDKVAATHYKAFHLD